MAGTETNAPPPKDGKQGVQLGVGTLIIIALIVTMCSGRSDMERSRKDTDELKKDAAEIKQQLREIDRKLDTLLLKGSAGNPVVR